MKSRITIDVDYDNQPCIQIEYQQSEDVRDKLIKRFLEKFEGKSYLCTITFSGDHERVTLIRPISPDALESHIVSIEALVKENE